MHAKLQGEPATIVVWANGGTDEQDGEPLKLLEILKNKQPQLNGSFSQRECNDFPWIYIYIYKKVPINYDRIEFDCILKTALKQLSPSSWPPRRPRSPITHRSCTGNDSDNGRVLHKIQLGERGRGVWLQRHTGSFMKGCSLVATGRKKYDPGMREGG